MNVHLLLRVRKRFSQDQWRIIKVNINFFVTKSFQRGFSIKSVQDYWKKKHFCEDVFGYNSNGFGRGEGGGDETL